MARGRPIERGVWTACELIVLFWLMIHLAITPGVLDTKLASNVNSLDQFFIAHSKNCHNMTAEEEMSEEELE